MLRSLTFRDYAEFAAIAAILAAPVVIEKALGVSWWYTAPIAIGVCWLLPWKIVTSSAALRKIDQ